METAKKRTPSGGPEAAAPSVDPLNLANRFEGLTVEDVDDDGYLPPQERPSVPPVAFERDESEVEHEFFMKIGFQMLENKRAREAALEPWHNYLEKYESTIPALITNCAIDLVRLQEEEFQRITAARPKRFRESEYPVGQLPALCFLWMTCLLQDKDQADRIIHPDLESIPPINWREGYPYVAKIADLCHVEVYQACQYFRRFTGANWLKTVRDIGIPDMEEDSKYHPIHTRTLKTLQLDKLAVLSSPQYLGEDEVSRGIRSIYEIGDPAPTWLMFGLQLHGEIEELLKPKQTEAVRTGASYVTPYKDLEETVEKLLLSVFDTKDAPGSWPGARNQTKNATRADSIKVLTHISAWTQDDEFSINSRVHYEGENLCRYLLSIIPED
jgi:hypothetical protein